MVYDERRRLHATCSRHAETEGEQCFVFSCIASKMLAMRRHWFEISRPVAACVEPCSVGVVTEGLEKIRVFDGGHCVLRRPARCQRGGCASAQWKAQGWRRYSNPLRNPRAEGRWRPLILLAAFGCAEDGRGRAHPAIASTTIQASRIVVAPQDRAEKQSPDRAAIIIPIVSRSIRA